MLDKRYEKYNYISYIQQLISKNEAFLFYVEALIGYCATENEIKLNEPTPRLVWDLYKTFFDTQEDAIKYEKLFVNTI